MGNKRIIEHKFISQFDQETEVSNILRACMMAARTKDETSLLRNKFSTGLMYTS